MTLRSVSTPCVKSFHQKKAISYARTVWKRETVSRKARQRLVRMRRCAYSVQARKNIRRANRKFRKLHRERKLIRSVTPYNCGSHGWFAVPCYIVAKESRFRCTAKNSKSSAYGYYQLLDTWYGHLGRYPTCAEQHRLAAKLWNGGRGVSNWSLTA